MTGHNQRTKERREGQLLGPECDRGGKSSGLRGRLSQGLKLNQKKKRGRGREGHEGNVKVQRTFQ